MKTLKTRKTYYSDIIKGEEYDKFLCIMEHFDSSENLIEKHTYNIDGSTTLSEYFQYDQGQMTRKEIYDPETDRRTISEYSYQGGLLIEEKELFENDQFIKTCYTYNSNNELIQVIQIDESKAIMNKTTLVNSPGKILINRFDENAQLCETESIDVDEEGNEVYSLITSFDVDEKRKTEAEEVMTISRVFENSNLIKEEIKRDDVLIESTDRAFDDRGNMVILEVNHFSVDYIIIFNFSYDENNLETSKLEFEDDRQILATYTKYDAQNKPMEVRQEQVSIDDYVAITRQEFVNTYYKDDEQES